MDSDQKNEKGAVLSTVYCRKSAQQREYHYAARVACSSLRCPSVLSPYLVSLTSAPVQCDSVMELMLYDSRVFFDAFWLHAIIKLITTRIKLVTTL